MKEEGGKVTVEDMKHYLKKAISLCMILCMIFSFRLGVKQLENFKIDKQDFKQQVSNVVDWEHMIVSVIRKINLTVMKQTMKIDRVEIIWILLQSIQIKLCYSLYMKVILIGFLIRSIFKIIFYIHHKDGPKRLFSPIVINGF